jgi:cytochrome d ubiquinol oxidase subunit II
VHGALYLWIKTPGQLSQRARQAAKLAAPLLVLVTVASLIATLIIRPELTRNYREYPIWFVLPLAVGGSLAMMIWAIARGRERMAFLCSVVYLSAMLGGAAVGLYPNVLPAIEPANSLTITNAATTPHTLQIGLYWWLPGVGIAIGYFVLIYSMFRGKVTSAEGHGY